METRVTVPLRAGGKKMRKRKELDALGGRGRRAHSAGGGVSSQDGLLSESTDDQEEQWRTKRHSNGHRGIWVRRRACMSVLRACTLVLVFACMVATTTVMWLFIDVREQATFLRNQLDQVVAGSQGVPEALQKCHSMSKQLQQNQTALFVKLTQLTSQLNNLSTQVSTISNSLNRVEERFKTSPELIKVPHDLDTLTSNIATFGSQMQDLVATVTQLKDANTRLTETTSILQSNLTNIRQEMSNISVLGVPVTSPSVPNVDLQFINTTISSLRANLSLINDTLTKKIGWSQEDLANQNKVIVGLQERNENVSTRVTSLQNECNAQALQLTNLTNSMSQLASQAKKQEEHWTQVSAKVSQLTETCDRLENNNTQLTAQLSSLKKALHSDINQPPSFPNLTTKPDPPNYSFNYTSSVTSHVLVITFSLSFILVFLCYWLS